MNQQIHLNTRLHFYHYGSILCSLADMFDFHWILTTLFSRYLPSANFLVALKQQCAEDCSDENRPTENSGRDWSIWDSNFQTPYIY